MILTTQQQATLRADIQGDPVLSLLPHTADSAFEIAAAYSAIPSPAWIVWKTSTTRQEILQNGFDWTRLDNLSVGKARIWSDIFVNGELNASKLNVRAGIEAVWVGTAADLAVRATVYGHCKRAANRIEKLMSTGTGSYASPATMTVEGNLSYNDVLSAMGW